MNKSYCKWGGSKMIRKKKGPVTSHLSFAGEVIEITGREKN